MTAELSNRTETEPIDDDDDESIEGEEGEDGDELNPPSDEEVDVSLSSQEDEFFDEEGAYIPVLPVVKNYPQIERKPWVDKKLDFKVLFVYH